jgi:DNA polymerase III delta' subunit
MGSIYEGNEVAVEILRASIHSGRIANAYLLRGTQSPVKEGLARAFARGLLCDQENVKESENYSIEDSIDDQFGCGNCWSCREVGKGAHPDLYLVEKEGASIKIKASHDILKEALSKPYHSKRKVFILNDAETMTLEASNAMLKVLEEPPPYITFVLLSSNVSALPDTIISRCQVVSVKGMAPSALAEYLTQEHSMDMDEARKIVLRADGSVHRAQELLSYEPEELDWGSKILSEIAGGSPVDLAWRYSREDAGSRKKFLVSLRIEMTNRLRSAICDAATQNYTSKNTVNCDKGLVTLYKALESIKRAEQRTKSNTNAFLTFSALFIDLKRFSESKRHCR